MAVATGISGGSTASAAQREDVRELAAELAAHASEAGGRMAAYIHQEIPDLGAPGDEEIVEETAASCEANIAAVLGMLSKGLPTESVVAPIEALEYARSMVRRGVALAVLLRAYRLGHAFLWRMWTQAVTERIDDPDNLPGIVEATSAYFFAYVDRLSDYIVVEYGAERERWVRSAAAVRFETVRAIIDEQPLDCDSASRSLGYELRRHHLAIVVAVDPESREATRGEPLERVASSLAGSLRVSDPLIVPTGMSSLWAWFGAHDDAGARELSEHAHGVANPGVRLALGEPGYGLDGFRESHLQAVHAHRLGALAGAGAERVISYSAVELVSLLTADLERARHFVARELGPLAAPGDSAERLRATVQAYLDAGASHLRAGQRLHIHQNTVAYRIRRAEELLGRPVTERRVEMEAALLLTLTLGAAALPLPSAD